MLFNKPVPYAPLRHSDLLWVKTVWQKIDLRQKMNQTFYFPTEPDQFRMSLFDNLVSALTKEGTLVAYSTGLFGDNDMFDEVLLPSEVEGLLVDYDTVQTPMLDESGFVDVIVGNRIESADVLWYEIKEQWYIDRQSSVMDVRIVGICPIIAVLDDVTGEFRGTKKLFWIYYPDARYTFATWPAYDHANDLQSISYDDLFRKRKFDAFIVKASNVHNRRIEEYATGKEALLEAEHEQTKLFEGELNMWEY
ncbi:MAG: gliding motility protein GldN [Flavobacteriales bacterium]|nr:gliding motility protein GldN [Flavobacteriales bacterium]